MNAINIFLNAFSILTNQNMKSLFKYFQFSSIETVLQDSRPKMSQALLNKAGH